MERFPMKRIFILAAVACIGWTSSLYGQQTKINALFIGNSLTYQNNLPELVKKIAACDGTQFSYNVFALPDYALEDHWKEGRAVKEIKSGDYNVVIVQQGPSSQTDAYLLLKDYGLKFSEVCKDNHSQLVFFMVWPSKARSFDFAGVYRSYKKAAIQTQSVFSPAGQAWLTLWKTHPDFLLYGPDNFHPHANGSLLAALVLYGSISNKKNLQFVNFEKLKINSLSADELKLLVSAAEQTLAMEKK